MWLGDIIVSTAQEWVNEMLNAVFGFVESFYYEANVVVGMAEVNSLLMVSNIAASSLLILLTMKQLLMIHILETDGDPDQDPLKILEKGCMALAMINLQNFILTKALKLADVICGTFMGTMEVGYGSAQDIIDLAEGFGLGNLVLLVVVCCYMMGFCKFLWRGLKRSGELALMKILFPFFVCDIVTVSMERFRAFFNSYMITIFGYIIQLVMYKLSVMMIYNAKDIWLSLAFVILAGNVPNWLEKYIYSTGASRGAGGIASSVIYMIPQIVRKVK